MSLSKKIFYIIMLAFLYTVSNIKIILLLKTLFYIKVKPFWVCSHLGGDFNWTNHNTFCLLRRTVRGKNLNCSFSSIIVTIYWLLLLLPSYFIFVISALLFVNIGGIESSPTDRMALASLAIIRMALDTAATHYRMTIVCLTAGYPIIFCLYRRILL